MGTVKQFIIHSKVLEITIGMIVAVAFERVISSMVSWILMPFIPFINGWLAYSWLYLVQFN